MTMATSAARVPDRAVPVGRGTALVARLYVDLQRVATALCITELRIPEL